MKRRLAIQRPVEQQGVIHAHKLPGVLGGSACSENIRQAATTSTFACKWTAQLLWHISTEWEAHIQAPYRTWQWCLQRGITLSADHLPGIYNTTGDAKSQIFHSSAKWQLLPSVFRRINTLFGPCQVDLFASRLNHQLPCYISWCPDPFSMMSFRTNGLASWGIPSLH